MERLILLALVCGTAAIVVVRLCVGRVHCHFESGIEVVQLEPRSVVHVLRTHDELQEAVRRASEFERRATDGLRLRADRYDAMIDPIAIAQPAPGQEARLSEDHAQSA
jgi:hypothetical protein